MKFLLLSILIVLLTSPTQSQVPEWMIVDVQELIMYDAIHDIFDFDLTNQEIHEISKGEYGTIWLKTQDYNIKYLPSNLVIYSLYDLENPLYFFPHSNFALTYYSRIDKKEIADKLPTNTWVKYDDPDSYDYAMWANEKKIVDESHFDFYKLNNYSIPLSEEKEITFNELLSSVLFNYPNLHFLLDGNKECSLIGRPDIDTSEKLCYKKNFKYKTRSEKIFDMLTDSDGNLWLATGKRLIRFDGIKFIEIDIPAIELESDFQNNLWIGTAAYNSLGSVVKFDGLKFTFYNSLNSPLPDNDGILDLKTDDRGNLWIALKRSGLPDHLDNIKFAIFNPLGVKFITSGILQSISLIREPMFKNIKSLFSDIVNINLNVREANPFSKIELLLNNKIISVIYSGTELTKDGDLNISYYLDKPDKYSFTAFLYDLNGKKIELANYELNYQFNYKGYFIGQNKPNPFSDYTRIEYGFFQGSMLALKIFNSFIRQVDSCKERYVEWMGRPFLFNSKNLPNGVYSYYLQENYSGIVDAKKMILFDPQKIITLPQKVSKP